MYKKKTHIHFVGIGGIGMSAIAHILKQMNYHVSGCDSNDQQKTVADLRHLGCLVSCPNNNPACDDASIDVLVYSSDIPENNPEFMRAQQRGIPVIKRATMLAELMRTKYSIAVAGSHGKTTTTSLISDILLNAAYDPTLVIGGNLHSINSNARYGKSEFLVAEADESDRSFLEYSPTLAVVTNIGLEHLNTFRDLDDVTQTFLAFLNKLPFYGKAFVCVDDPVIRSILPLENVTAVTYGFAENSDWKMSNLVLHKTSCTFSLEHNGHTYDSITLAMAGKHNALNATAAFAVAHELEVPTHIILDTLKNFSGVDRRFTFRGVCNGAEIFDDYGHHPTEIRNTLAVAKNRAKGKLHVLFQPHRYTRMHKLWGDFLTLFATSDIDHLIITDLHTAGEKAIEGVTSELFTQELRKLNPKFTLTYLPLTANFNQITSHLKATLESDDLLLLQGAGKANQVADTLIS